MNVYLATLDTAHFTFTAWGRTEEDAMQTLRTSLRNHGRQLDIVEPFWWDEGDIVVKVMLEGVGYRDWEPL